MTADREIKVEDTTGSVSAATSPQIAALLAALGITAQLTNARPLADGDYGPVSVAAGVWDLDAAAIVAALQGQTDAEKRSDGLARHRLVRAAAATFSEGDIPVATSVDGEFIPATPIPDTPATALDMAGRADQAASLNPRNAGIWTKRTALAMGSPATLDWSGVETVPGTLDGHSLNVRLMATAAVAIQAGTIAVGLEGQPFAVVVQNGGGGVKPITVQDHAGTGAKVVLADGLTLPAIGTGNGDQLVLRGWIAQSGSVDGLWVVSEATKVTAPVSGYTPSWVSNGGTGWLSYDGAAFGTDGQSLDVAVLLRDLDGNPATTCRIVQTHGAALDMRFGSTGGLAITVRDTTGAPLVEWASTGAEDAAGTWLFHIAVNLGASPTFTVSKSQVTGGTPGAWLAVAGSFTAGPTTGTIDNRRAFGGVDLAVLATTAGASVANCDLAYLWISHSAPLANSDFATGGMLIDPAAVGSPVVLITGPVADLDTDKGSAALTLVVNGTWTNA